VEESASIRDRLQQLGCEYVAAPVSGNAKVIKAGKLSAVISGSEAACKTAAPLVEVIAPRGVSYVGGGELARVCKIAHNVMLGVVIENLIEITLLANKMGVPRHAFLAFMNNSVMGSMFTRYKSPALVNLDWTTTFTPELLRKDLDLGLALGREWDVPMPVTAATREVLQSHFGAATLKPNPEEYLQEDFAALMEAPAEANERSGITAAAMRRKRCSKFGDAAAPSMCRKCFGSSASSVLPMSTSPPAATSAGSVSRRFGR
jgi:3-hydroxyisobutyrate dehydrogenase